MDSCLRAILAILVLVCVYVVGIFVMIHGWGVQAESWGIIIGGVFVQMFLFMLAELLKDK